MKLGLMIYGQPDQLSGGYLYDRQLVKAWRQQGHQVQFLSLPAAPYWASVLHNYDRGWRDRLAGLQIDALIQDELCHPSLFLLNRQIRPLAEFPIISLVHHLRTSEEHPQPMSWLYRLIERSYLATVDGFIFNSRPTGTSVQRLLGRSTSAVIAPPGRDHLEDGSAAESLKNIDPAAPLHIVFVGNVIKRKGLHWLLEALAEFQDDPWTLEVVGRLDLEPGYSQSMMNRIVNSPLAGRIRVHGPIQKQALGRIYKRADVLAVPSAHEGFGLVYLEAMGFGLPVLASASGGASDLIDPGKNGFLVDPGDVPDLQRSLRAYIQDRELLTRHSRAARERFEQQPTWSETAASVINYLEGG